MKTYTILCAIFALLIFSCSKSESVLVNDEEGENESPSIDVNYITLLSKNGFLKPQLLTANGEAIALNPTESSLAEKTIPDLSFVDGSYFMQYHKVGACAGELTTHDFNSDTTAEIAVFTDLNDCDLTATAIAKSGNLIFISYQVTSSNPSDYLVRIIDLNSSEFSAVDISLDNKPVDLAISNNRLFILIFDELITDEYNLTVLDISTKAFIHEMGLGNSVRRIFTDTKDNVVISYDELHTTLNSNTLDFVYTQYPNGTAPEFGNTKSTNFDLEGRLFYPMDPSANSTYPLVPAIYDFSKKLVVLYAYENFLTEEERNFEYEIETTTGVAYDEKNGVMLVGYKKMSTADKEGGVLRIKLAPEPKLIDNINLDGVPIEIFIN